MLDPNPAADTGSNKITFDIKGTQDITCNKNAVKVVESLEEMSIIHDLKKLSEIAPAVLTMDQKDRLMKHTVTYMNQI